MAQPIPLKAKERQSLFKSILAVVNRRFPARPGGSTMHCTKDEAGQLWLHVKIPLGE